jgi:hypothetical protein
LPGPRELCEELLKLYKWARSRVEELDPGSERLVVSDEVCKINPTFCEEAKSIARKVYQELQRLSKAAREAGLEETAMTLIVIAEHDWGKTDTYSPDTLLQALPVLVEEAWRHEARPRGEAQNY